MSEQSISINEWSATRRFLFLLILSYTFFYIFPFPLDTLPFSGFIFRHYEGLTYRIIYFIGKHILHITEFKKQAYSDSGDTAFDHIKIFTYFILALLTSVSLFIFANKKINYEKLNYWFFISLRYAIGFYMLVYGFDKVFKSHFPFLNLEKLEQPFGESSPQGLLWAFMGYSTTYSVFLGIVEVLSGFLLLFRRTVTFGALLVMMIMVNVVLINFSYDVPVKLFALHIVFFTLLILYPSVRSIINFFFLNKETKLPEQIVSPLPKLISSYRKIIKTILIVGFTGIFMNFSITNMKMDGDNAPKPTLYGIYKSTGFEMYPTRNINEIIFDTKNTVIKSRTNNTLNSDIKYYDTKTDTINKIIYFQSNSNPSEKFKLNYTLKNNDLTLTENDSSISTFKKSDLNQFPLINRKFHWVEEFPFNN